MHRSRLLLILLTAAVVTAACGGGDDEPVTRAADAPALTTTTQDPSEPESSVAAGDTTTTDSIGTDAAPAPTSEGAEPEPGRQEQAPAEARPSAPTPVPAGTYRYRQSGSFTFGTTREDLPPEGTLVADPPSGSGTQRLHRYMDPERPPNESTVQFTPDGVFLVETVQRAQGMEFRCRFEDPGLPVPPWPPRVGATFAGRADCGQLTVAVEGRITDTRETTIEDHEIDSYVIESTITTSGSVESTTEQVDWYAPSLQLSVRTESDTRGQVGTLSFTANSVSELLSDEPT